ncbi:MAG: hypothetical protein GX631_07135 [Dehalococcoidales bacterium]|nr:hypothetical protein [Dehalococcoidales bacterium]
MAYILYWTDSARNAFNSLKNDASKKIPYKAVKKALEILAENPRYPGLQTHPFSSLQGPGDEKVFESYAQNDTPGAYRLFWYYGADEIDDEGNRPPAITVFTMTPHPD